MASVKNPGPTISPLTFYAKDHHNVAHLVQQCEFCWGVLIFYLHTQSHLYYMQTNSQLILTNLSNFIRLLDTHYYNQLCMHCQFQTGMCLTIPISPRCTLAQFDYGRLGPAHSTLGKYLVMSALLMNNFAIIL